MANAVNFFSSGSQSKPPTLLRDEYPQWKIRMVQFLEGVDAGLVEFLHNPPFIPMTNVPRVPATATTPEVPEYQHPKPIDHEKQLEGGAKTQKNNNVLCINEYYAFKALPNETIQSTYDRFNSLINKCKRYGIHITPEENNARFLQSLNDEWLHFTMSLQATLDLDVWSISGLFGNLEKGKKNKAGEEILKKKKKKVLVAESEDDDSAKEEMDMDSMAKTLALMTKEYNRGLRKKPMFNRGKDERDDKRGYGEHDQRKFGREEHEEKRDDIRYVEQQNMVEYPQRDAQRSDGRGGEKTAHTE
ncbi:hypothetical protein L6452_42142 [Arctium lappa]|uniref:Uncharacterized protein n=1 Tax=Arctium lappa TaxID=4217 RepID=A0ACB8XIM1_ARCLA|nr:hypothetical protein L6452_42142 [Arctium lappa]